MKKEVVAVIIVGAGPSGLATSACLNLHSVPNVILEKEHCHSSLWKSRAYDRLKLHLAKEFCSLPHMPHSPQAPTFVPRLDFIRYLDNYVERFNVQPTYGKSVESASYDEISQTWVVLAKDTTTMETEEYVGKYLVVATGENGHGYIPMLPGLESFTGEVLHSKEYKSGSKYKGERVLVVGCGNSGMEIAYDLCDHGADTSIVVRNPFHVVTKEMIHVAMTLLKYLPVWVVDALLLVLIKLKYGDLSMYGIVKPTEGPMTIKAKRGRSAVIDVGTIAKIKSGEIQVMPAISRIEVKEVTFTDGKSHYFDAIVFATGYKSTAKDWLDDENDLLNEEGMPTKGFPNHWKGKNGIYCAGLSRRGLEGISMDAKNIADDIKKAYHG